jgi:hypothetical protein
MHIHLPHIQPKHLHTIQSLTRKRLIDLPKVNIGFGDPNFLEYTWDGVCGAYTHDSGGHTDGGGGYVFAEDGEVESSGDGAAGEEDGGGAVGDLGGVAWEGGG